MKTNTILVFFEVSVTLLITLTTKQKCCIIYPFSGVFKKSVTCTRSETRAGVRFLAKVKSFRDISIKNTPKE